jgi:hypothetical protein
MERKMDLEDTHQFTRLVDWLLPLPPALQEQVWNEVRQFVKEKQMPFLSYPEQTGMEKGLQQGLQHGIELALKLKFPGEGLQLLPAIQAQQDLAVLQKVFAAIEPATSLDDIRRLLP